MKSDIRYMSQVVDWCIALEVDPDEVIGKSRAGVHLVEARHAINWLLRDRFRLSYPQIGRLLNRDHTTAMHSVSKVANAIRTEEPWIVSILEHAGAPKPIPMMELESPLDTLRRCAAVVRSVEGALG